MGVREAGGPFILSERELAISAMNLLSGKQLHGWPSGSAVESEDTMDFSVLTGVRAQIEEYPLEQANEAFARMMSNQARFRVVLKIS